MTDPYIQAIADGFSSELKKLAGAELQAGKGIIGALAKHKRELGGVAGGVAAYKVLSTAERDRRMGRQMRIQQGY